MFSYVKMLIFHTVVAESAFGSLIIFHVISHVAQDKRYVYFCLLHFNRYLKKALLRGWLGEDLILLLEKCIIWSTHHLKRRNFFKTYTAFWWYRRKGTSPTSLVILIPRPCLLVNICVNYCSIHFWGRLLTQLHGNCFLLSR